MKTIMYELWSEDANTKAEKVLLELRCFSILDIELSGQCNFNCCYCDSPDRNKPYDVPMDKIKSILLSGKIKYVFICGLGEPTAVGQNYNTLVELLRICKEVGIQCSMFTNLYYLTDALLEYIKSGTLNILFKLDSFDPTEVVNIYGIPLSMAEAQIENIKRVTKLVREQNGLVNIGASIVPTRLNYKGILSIIKKCLELGIYPLLTDLEDSGSATAEYSDLSLNPEELNNLKLMIGAMLGKEYNPPVCPSVISGVHINHRGKVTVDARSGLSCGWFWANEPIPYLIGDIHTESFQDICDRILKFREEKLSSFAKAVSMKSSCDNQVFGGCGGNIKLLLERYKRLHKGGVL